MENYNIILYDDVTDNIVNNYLKIYLYSYKNLYF